MDFAAKIDLEFFVNLMIEVWMTHVIFGSLLKTCSNKPWIVVENSEAKLLKAFWSVTPFLLEE